MQTPLFLVGDGDVQMFSSREELERELEPIDARSGHFKAFDGEGKLLDISVIQSTKGLLQSLWGFGAGRERVVVSEYLCAPKAGESLDYFLRNFLAALGYSDSVKEAPLNELVSRVAMVLKYDG